MATTTVVLAGDWMESVGNRRATRGTIQMNASYATGGDDLTPAQVGLGVIDHIEINQGEDGYVLHYDKANDKVLAYWGDNAGGAADPATALLEVTAATDLSGVVAEFRAIGQ